ncbi:HAD family hydrolase [Thalassovita sp.]|uniref:HAD family hydrolase n=1 Tax=Thalassovita sp. TaxID=1979401 RepID=UPI0029DE8F6E|nr:HAD family hydrolase [Thalassovita sp.]
MQIEGVLFDKDGTLFDFRATWDGWAGRMIGELAGGDTALALRVAGAVQYDLRTGGFDADSPFVAGSNDEVAEALARVLPQYNALQIEQFLSERAVEATLAPAVDLVPFLAGLAARGLALGVMTNDSEYSARAHLSEVGVVAQFHFIAGFDSGFGAKPSPRPLLAFADRLGLEPEAVVMVGDSTHDLIAGRRAGMRTIGVLTGTAGRDELAPLADVVLPDIGHIPSWLDDQQG